MAGSRSPWTHVHHYTDPTQAQGRPLPATDPWLLWSVEGPRDHEVLSIAELAECSCPELCDRDHANE